jgi:hypothetical protein
VKSEVPKPGSAIAVTAQEATAGVVAVVIVPRVNPTLNTILQKSLDDYVTFLSPYVDSSQSSGLKQKTATC